MTVLAGGRSRPARDAVQRVTLAVQVFVRPASLTDPVDEKIRRLQQFDADGVVDALLVRAWPNEVPLGADDVDTEVVEVYERFAAWADREGASIEPSFHARTRDSSITGASREVLTTPVMCLAIYENEALESVYPHTDEDGHHTVGDAIEALASDRYQPTAGGRPRPLVDDRCPACGSGVVNVQGLAACHDCTWVAAPTT